jgi:hypothetical protein
VAPLADNLLRPPKRTQSSCPVDCRRWSTEFLSTASFWIVHTSLSVSVPQHAALFVWIISHQL